MDELLGAFLRSTRDAREYKRALAVQIAAQGYPYEAIGQLLQVSEPFVSTWKRVYAEQGVVGLRLGYQGSTGQLTETERAEVLAWIEQQEHCDLARLQAYLGETYAVTYQSTQSYYDLLHAAGLRWKKVQSSNPKKRKPGGSQTRRSERICGGLPRGVGTATPRDAVCRCVLSALGRCVWLWMGQAQRAFDAGRGEHPGSATLLWRTRRAEWRDARDALSGRTDGPSHRLPGRVALALS